MKGAGVAIVFSAFAVEAWVNESGADAGSPKVNTDHQELADRWHEAWTHLEEVKKAQPPQKFKAGYRLMPGAEALNATWWCDVRSLFDLRSSLDRQTYVDGKRTTPRSKDRNPIPETERRDFFADTINAKRASWAVETATTAIRKWAEASPLIFSHVALGELDALSRGPG